MDEKKKVERVHLILSGRVQGVAFRYSALACARRLGITGWVQNLPDGRVETIAEGERRLLESYAQWCHKGPPAAQVSDIVSQWDIATGEFSKFTIR